MASPSEVIATLARRGVFLRAHPDGALHVTGVSKLTEAEKVTIRDHKKALLRALDPPATPQRPPHGSLDGAPDTHCPTCGGGHFWHDRQSWRCSGCHPMPVCFQGHSVTVHGGEQSYIQGVIRSQIEVIHPEVVQGIPLSVILDQAHESDYEDLLNRSILEAFTRSLVATGTIDTGHGCMPAKSADATLVLERPFTTVEES